MQKQAPTLGRILVMSIFTLSCFGLLLYLWSAFGGPVPLKPHGYRFETSFAEATQLAQEADVRISGVNVGRVKKIDLGEGRTDATIELDDQYAPIPQDSRAILRQKTLLGETYVELTPGTNTAPKIPEGGRLETAQVAPTVELDEILRAFDKKTREGFQTWQQDLGKGIEGQGAGFSEFLGVLPAFAQDTNKVLEVLNTQERATREAIKNTGVVFDALTERGDQLAQWIDNSNDLLRTTGRRDDSLRALFRAFPTFIDESNVTLKALGAYAENTTPVLRALTPASTQLSNVLTQLSAIAPDFNEFFIGLNRVIPASVEGLPASSRFLDDTAKLFGQLDPVLRNFNPFFEYLAMFKREIAGMLANDTAVTQATDQIGQDRVHYLRLTSPVNPEALSTYPQRQGWHRGNPYYAPGNYDQLKGGLPVFDPDLCFTNGFPTLGPSTASMPEELRNRIILYVLNSGNTVAPPCRKQAPFNVGGRTTDYPQVTEAPKPSP
jgi:phospholipid/cholesterol/gamma-HCH transport system substrate-binding protein